MKTNRALCGLIAGLLLLAAGTAQTHAGLLVPAGPGANLYVANAGSNTIDKFTPGGTGSVFASSGLNFPFSLAFDSAGNLYAANYGDNTIERFTPGGVGSVFASTGLSLPEGLAFDSAGNLYAANYNNNTIEKFTPAGVGSVFASSGLSQPTFLAFGPVEAVPEPGTALFGMACVGVAALRRRRSA